jgi:hypothetical protein
MDHCCDVRSMLAPDPHDAGRDLVPGGSEVAA